MGYTMHHDIVVTGRPLERVKALRDEIAQVGLPVTNVVEALTNGDASFMVGPDGSKWGWVTILEGGRQRDRINELLEGEAGQEANAERAEVRHVDDSGDITVVRHTGNSMREQANAIDQEGLVI